AEPAFDIVEPLGQEVAGELPDLVRRAGLEHWREALVQLGGDEVDPFEYPVSAEIANRRQKLVRTGAIAEILQYHRILRQHLAVIELERWDNAFRVDLQIGAAAVEHLAAEVHHGRVTFEADFMQQDVRSL